MQVEQLALQKTQIAICKDFRTYTGKLLMEEKAE